MKENSTLVNWNYITISLVIFVLITVAVLYMPGMREIDMEILKSIRKFLGQFPKYIPVFFSNYGGVGNFYWPQVAAYAVLISHQRYLKTFLLIFFTQGTYFLVDNVIKNFVCRERPSLYHGYSFPSGHSMASMSFYGLLIYIIYRSNLPKKWKIVGISLLTLLILFVRVCSTLPIV